MQSYIVGVMVDLGDVGFLHRRGVLPLHRGLACSYFGAPTHSAGLKSLDSEQFLFLLAQVSSLGPRHACLLSRAVLSPVTQ